MNKKIIALFVGLLIITNGFTSVVAYNSSLLGKSKNTSDVSTAVSSENTNAVVPSGKILIDKSEYEALKSVSGLNKKVGELENFILDKYYKEFDRKNFEDGILKGIFESLNDPYSVYMNKEEFDRFLEDTKGMYRGVGIIVRPTDDGMVTVVSPIEDTPAQRAGIESGDKILKVDDMDVTAEVMDEAVRRMRGKVGETVHIEVYRPSIKKNVEFDITREDIRLKTVKSRMIGDVGYIRISMFDSLTSDDFLAQLDVLLKDDPKGLIIDLRNNPGGSVAEVVKVADRLLGKQMIVYTKDRDGKKNEYKSGFLKVDLPLVILTNGGSASASEILSGAVQDTGAGTIVGEKTFGKGIVQTVFPLDDGSGMKLTTSEYFTPNGTNIHGIGITPDVVVKMPESYKEIKNPKDSDDPQLQKAIEIINNKSKE